MGSAGATLRTSTLCLLAQQGGADTALWNDSWCGSAPGCAAGSSTSLTCCDLCDVAAPKPCGIRHLAR